MSAYIFHHRNYNVPTCPEAPKHCSINSTLLALASLFTEKKI
jgi:hypothetical protein